MLCKISFQIFYDTTSHNFCSAIGDDQMSILPEKYPKSGHFGLVQPYKGDLTKLYSEKNEMGNI